MIYVVGKEFNQDAIVVRSYSRAIEIAKERKANVYDCFWNGTEVVCTELIYASEEVM